MISVIVPVYNESENIRSLLDEFKKLSNFTSISEIIYVDDKSDDNTVSILEEIQNDYPLLRVIKHTRRAGQSAAFMTGARAAGNKIIVLMDGDGQNDPADIQKLFDCYQKSANENKKAMVAGQRLKRRDSFLKRLSSRLANKIRASILHDNICDTGCSLKLIRREDYIRLPYFNHMHRYIPALLKREGVEILTVDVSHRPREKGVSKYGFWDRLWVGIFDLAGVRWLLNRALPEGFEAKEECKKS